MSDGWRKSWGNVIDAIRGTLADASNAGSMTAAAFLKLAGLPSSAVPTTRAINTTAPMAGGGPLSADLTLSTALADAVNSGLLSADDFAKLATALGGSAGLIPQAFVTPTFNLLTAAGTFQNFNAPLVAGKKFHILSNLIFHVVTRDAAWTLNMTGGIAQNGTVLSNVANITLANVNTQAAPEFVVGSISACATPDMTTFPLQFKTVVAPTGPTVCTGFAEILGVYV